MELLKAIEIATYLSNRFAPACERIEIVGSCKRGDKSDVHDIEILLIPKNQRPVPEFGKPNNVYKSVFEKVLSDLHYEDYLRHPMNRRDGDKYKKRAIVEASKNGIDFCLDLFIVTHQTWAIQNVIRTGPSLFSHRFVTNKSKTVFIREGQVSYRGLLPDKYEYVKGETVIKEAGKILELKEEQDAIDLLGVGWIDPADRREFAMKR